MLHHNESFKDLNYSKSAMKDLFKITCCHKCSKMQYAGARLLKYSVFKIEKKVCVH